MTKINCLLICFLFLAACNGKPDKNVTVATQSSVPQIKDNAADDLLALQLKVQRQPRDSVLKKEWQTRARRDKWLFIWGVARRGTANRAMQERALRTDARRWILVATTSPASGNAVLRGTVPGRLKELRRITRSDSICVLYAYKNR